MCPILLRLFLLDFIFCLNPSVFAVESAESKEEFSRFFLVSTPAADLRRDPVPAKENDLTHDPLQETQLLYGEMVKVLEEKNKWSRVEAIEQSEWSHREKWEGYPGWVRSDPLVPLSLTGWKPNAVVTTPLAPVYQEPNSDSPILLELFMGTKMMMDSHAERGNETDKWRSLQLVDGRAGWVQKDQIASLVFLHQLSTDQVRQRIVRNARSLEGKPYYWGGLSAGVDCSGLVHLAYRAAGIDLPRDAHEQWMKSNILDIPVGTASFSARGRSAYGGDGAQGKHAPPLQSADLIFLSSEEDPSRISHVMLYLGDGKIIEGPGTGKSVHEILLDEKLSQNNHRKVYYATYFPKN